MKVAPPLIVDDEQMDQFITSVSSVVQLAHLQSIFWSEAIGLATRALGI